MLKFGGFQGMRRTDAGSTLEVGSSYGAIALEVSLIVPIF
jgi:hypothetical protein